MEFNKVTFTAQGKVRKVSLAEWENIFPFLVDNRWYFHIVWNFHRVCLFRYQNRPSFENFFFSPMLECVCVLFVDLAQPQLAFCLKLFSCASKKASKVCLNFSQKFCALFGYIDFVYEYIRKSFSIINMGIIIGCADRLWEQDAGGKQVFAEF